MLGQSMRVSAISVRLGGAPRFKLPALPWSRHQLDPCEKLSVVKCSAMPPE